MKIWKHLNKKHIFLDVLLPTKEAVFRFVADTWEGDQTVPDAVSLYKTMMARERTMSTGIGGGIGLPHAVSRDAEDATVMLIRLAAPIDFKALDARPVDLILAMVIPANRMHLHLRLLAGVSRLCLQKEFLSAVRMAGDPGALWQEIRDVEEQMAFH